MVPDKTWMHLGLLFINVKPTGSDLSGIKCGDKSGFVDDTTAGSVDYDDTRFHFCEFGSGKKVVS